MVFLCWAVHPMAKCFALTPAWAGLVPSRCIVAGMRSMRPPTKPPPTKKLDKLLPSHHRHCGALSCRGSSWSFGISEPVRASMFQGPKRTVQGPGSTIQPAKAECRLNQLVDPSQALPKDFAGNDPSSCSSSATILRICRISVSTTRALACGR